MIPLSGLIDRERDRLLQDHWQQIGDRLKFRRTELFLPSWIVCVFTKVSVAELEAIESGEIKNHLPQIGQLCWFYCLSYPALMQGDLQEIYADANGLAGSTWIERSKGASFSIVTGKSLEAVHPSGFQSLPQAGQ